MELAAILDKNIIDVNFNAKSKDEALKKISQTASGSVLMRGFSENDIYKALKEREEMGTTGFGGGVAMPHARIRGLPDFVVFVLISKKGVDFEALDSKKVNIFCVILAPEENVNEHLKILAAFSRYLAIPGFKKELVSSKNPDVVFEALARQSAGLPYKSTGGKMKLMILVLYFDEYLYQILEYLIEHGVKGATIMDSDGMGTYISSIPLFASFLGFMREDKNKSKTIMCLVPEEGESSLIEGIERITGDLNKKEGAMIMTMDLSVHRGTMEII